LAASIYSGVMQEAGKEKESEWVMAVGSSLASTKKCQKHVIAL